MARGHLAGQFDEHVLVVEHLRHMADAAVREELARFLVAIKAGDAHRFLAAVLQRVQPQRRHGRGRARADHAENAAFLVQRIAIAIRGRDVPRVGVGKGGCVRDAGHAVGLRLLRDGKGAGRRARAFGASCLESKGSLGDLPRLDATRLARRQAKGASGKTQIGQAGAAPGKALGKRPAFGLGGAPLGMPLFDDGGVSDGKEAQRCGRKVGHCGWAMMAMAAMAAPAGTGLCRRARGAGAAGPAAYRDGGRGCA
jgi:hypothetical protein